MAFHEKIKHTLFIWFPNKFLKSKIKENIARFGAYDFIEQLEKAKKGTDYDFALAKVRQSFCSRVKTIVLFEENDSNKKIELLKTAISVEEQEYKQVIDKFGQSL